MIQEGTIPKVEERLIELVLRLCINRSGITNVAIQMRRKAYGDLPGNVLAARDRSRDGILDVQVAEIDDLAIGVRHIRALEAGAAALRCIAKEFIAAFVAAERERPGEPAPRHESDGEENGDSGENESTNHPLCPLSPRDRAAQTVRSIIDHEFVESIFRAEPRFVGAFGSPPCEARSGCSGEQVSSKEFAASRERGARNDVDAALTSVATLTFSARCGPG